MLPVVAIVGRPNVGKSTLFNCLTQTRDALVADMPGLTRDRIYGEGKLGDKPFIVIDTGGIGESQLGVENLMQDQAFLASEEADVILFMVDAKAGLTPVDQEIAQQLRQINKPIYLVVNKIDGLSPELASAEFYQLGLNQAIPIAATHGRGVTQLIAQALESFEVVPSDTEFKPKGINIAIVGRPNVGKSTLVNRMLGEERVIVFDMPGTTRDSIYIPFERNSKEYTLIDTAGVRKRGKVKETVEKFSIIKTLQAIESSHVCIVLLDAHEGVTEQDLHLIGFVIEAGKALIIAINKWDGLTLEEKERLKSEMHRRLSFAHFAEKFTISALHGSRVGELFPAVDKAYQSAMQPLSTPFLTKVLEDAVKEHQPPLVRGRRIKLRYAHAGGHNPPLIVIHGNQTPLLPESYKRFLINAFRNALDLSGTPLRIELKSNENPYKGVRNQLTPRQTRKKRRMMKHYKSKK